MAKFRRVDVEVLSGCNPPPDIQTVCCRPCDTTLDPKECPSRTNAEDAVFIQPNEAIRAFKITYDGCGDVVPVCSRIKMEIRKKGTCDVIQTIVPYKADIEGNIWFAWCDMKPGIWMLDPAQYEGDIYVDCKTCGSVLLVIRQCHMFFETTASARQKCEAPPLCATQEDICCGVVPAIEQPTAPMEGCNEECGKC